jgi:type IV pilus assembly protein PilM
VAGDTNLSTATEANAISKDALSRNTAKNREHAEVLLMAAPREMVQKYVRVAQLAGLTMLGLEIESFALSRSAISQNSTPVLLLDLGAFSSSVAVFDEGFLRVVHNIAVSSVDLTRACSRALGTDLNRAEAQKRSLGLYASGGEAEIATAYLPLLDALARDCERVISAYWRLAARKVGSVVISGNAALLKGLDRYITSRLQIPASPVNPFARVVLPKELTGVSSFLRPELANAVGLAMKEV